ncbi:hypothetical protein ACP70R_036908 [Stipagrostis hirtigluma subsp. patula]
MSSSSSDAESGVPPFHSQFATDPIPASQIQLVNIKSHVPIVLDLHESNYGVWSQSFTVVFAKFGLLDHVNGSTPRGDSEWIQNDFAIVSWVYVTISPEILQMVQTKSDTAYKIWRAVRSLFLDNKEARNPSGKHCSWPPSKVSPRSQS